MIHKREKVWGDELTRRVWPMLAILLLTANYSAKAQTLSSAGIVLSFPALANATYGIVLKSSGEAGQTASSAEPVRIQVCGPCDESHSPNVIGVGYSSVERHGENIVATAKVSTPAGSIFQVEDEYERGENPGYFALHRILRVIKSSGKDEGYNSEFTIGFPEQKMIEREHFFAPGIWYNHNDRVAPGAIASRPSDTEFFWRETRSPLPLVMMQDDSTGKTVALGHVQSTPRSGEDERSQKWIVSSSVQYGSLGVYRVPQLMLGFVFPAEEGSVTYVGGKHDGWVRRSNPVKTGGAQEYTLVLGLRQYSGPDGKADYDAALRSTWRAYFGIMHPPLANIPMDTVYHDGLSLLNHYFVAPDGAAGFPFSVNLPDGSVHAISFQMGFVGEQLPLAFELLREGVVGHDAQSLAHGKAILNFWASRAAQPSGLPLTWYKPDSHSFRDTECTTPTFLRTASEGMEGMLRAAEFMRTTGAPEPAWEHFAQAYGDWLVRSQNKDGSWYRAFNPDGSVFTRSGEPHCSQKAFGTSKFNTSNPLRFLAMLYFATHDPRYKQAAIAGGEYLLATTVNTTQYVGGVVDNPNVLDRESGAVALRSLLALYDLNEDPKWLDAARKAADYTETWQYAWTFPVANAPTAYRTAGAQSIGLIATGQSGADIYLSEESYDFYRLHLFGDSTDQHYLQMALYLENNTKLTTQLRGVAGQQFGFAVNGLVGEAYGVSSLAFFPNARDAALAWLPWITSVEIDPIGKMKETFGVNSIREAERSRPALLLEENKHPYASYDSAGWGGSPRLPAKAN